MADIRAVDCEKERCVSGSIADCCQLKVVPRHGAGFVSLGASKTHSIVLGIIKEFLHIVSTVALHRRSAILLAGVKSSCNYAFSISSAASFISVSGLRPSSTIGAASASTEAALSAFAGEF